MSVSTLQQKLRQQKNQVGLVGGTAKVAEYADQDAYVAAHIDPNGWNIEVTVKKGWEPIKDRRQRAYARVKKIIDGLETIVMHVGGLHEPAHWELPYGSGRGCPFDAYHHDKITQAVTEALPADKKGMAAYVTNAFEDIVINPRCKEYGKDFSGQVLFWDWEGIRCEEQGKKGFTPFYQSFVALNMHLWGDKVDKALVKRHYQPNKKVDTAVTNVIRDLRLEEDIKDTAPLFDRSRWQQMAGAFARNLADLLDEQPSERLSAYEPNGDAVPQSGGKKQQPAGNGIEQRMRTREGKESVAYGRYAGGEGQSPQFTDFEQLDALYRRLARAIPVKVEAMSREQGLQIGVINYRRFDEERDAVARIKPTKLLIGEDGLTFGVGHQPLAIVARSKIQQRGFPNFKMVILDNSGSMRHSPTCSMAGCNGACAGSNRFIPWRDGSKYHYALLGFYGVENYLQQQGVAQYINHGVALFSSATRVQEGSYADIDKVRKHALKPDWGNTVLDASALKKPLEGKESFVLSISDGEIANWTTERDTIKPLFERNYAAHIQVGDENEFTRDLASWGKPVFYVRSGTDLSKLMVEATVNTYRRFTKQ